MDIFRFTNPNNPAKMENGEIVNGITNKLWIERYNKPGEFTLVGNVKSGLREALPVGSYISHVNTSQIMTVENHEIVDNENSDGQITITGRSFETFLENRIFGSNKRLPTYGEVISDIVLPDNYIFEQAKKIIDEQINISYVYDRYNAIPWLSVTNLISPSSANRQEYNRTVKRGTVYSIVSELMQIGLFGVKTIRPGPFSPVPSSPNVFVAIHNGNSLSQGSNQPGLDSISFEFTYDEGIVVNADYLWSNKEVKTAAYVTSKWMELLVTRNIESGTTLYTSDGTPYIVTTEDTSTALARKVLYIDASSVDSSFSVSPTTDEFVSIKAALEAIAEAALSNQSEIILTKAEIKENSSTPRYRRDYNLGDKIFVRANYGIERTMRIIEHVEIEDENGETSYPTVEIYKYDPNYS